MWPNGMLIVQTLPDRVENPVPGCAYPVSNSLHGRVEVTFRARGEVFDTVILRGKVTQLRRSETAYFKR